MKQIKSKIASLLIISTLLNTSFLSTYTKISGFHITVKVSNVNLVTSISHWNHDSNYLNENINNNPLKINFDNYNQIINNDWKSIPKNNNKNIIDSIGYTQTQNRITNNNKEFVNSTSFTNDQKTAFGHTFNTNNQSIIISYQETIKEKINQGLFEIINEKSNLETLMTVPYDLVPSASFQDKDISERAQIFPIGPLDLQTSDNIRNQYFVFYVHKPFEKDNKGLNITINNQKTTNSINIKTNINNTFSYAILNQQYENKTNEDDEYNIQWKDEKNKVLNEKSIKIISSMPTINAPNSTHQYFINNKSSKVIAFSQIKNLANISFNNNEKWTCQKMNDKLEPEPEAKIENLTPNTTLNAIGKDHTIYLLQRTTNDNKIDISSQQYLNVWTVMPLQLKINDYCDFATSNQGQEFSQYLKEATNVNFPINDLNAGQLRYWLLFYIHDLSNHLYVNINNDKHQDDNNCWALKQQPLTLITIVNHWNVVIIGTVILLVILIILVIVLTSRKKKNIK